MAGRGIAIWEWRGLGLLMCVGCSACGLSSSAVDTTAFDPVPQGTAIGTNVMDADGVPLGRTSSLEDTSQLGENDRSRLPTDTLERVEVVTTPFKVCADFPDWERPSEEAHMEQLAANPRYGISIYEEPLKSLLRNYRSHAVMTFTTYGLSARAEPIYLSGIWPVLDDLWTCYENEQITRINAGELAEIWVFNYRIQSLEWTRDHYQLIVEPTESGFQLVQFERQESEPALTLTVETVAGRSINVMSGDW